MSTMDISVGPQHPGSGHFRMIIKVDGDIIRDVTPDPGYVHRGCEKIAEYRNYIKNIPMLERPAILDSTHMNWGYIRPIEELQGVKVPPRGEYIRTIIAEITRMVSHLYWLAIYGPFLGHTTIFMWSFGDRETLIDLAEWLTGARITYSFIVPGGVRRDLPSGFTDRALKTLEYFERRLHEQYKIFFNNPLVIARTKGIGVLSRQDAILYGATGPVLRSTGVKYDVRKVEPYGAYNDLDFEIPVYQEGDTYSRMMIHFNELKQSANIIRQALQKIPKGPICVKAPLVVPRGEAVGRVESARGELSFYLVADGSDKPYRLKMNTGSFRNLAVLQPLLKGAHIGDMPSIYWGLDYWPVEADR